MDEILTGLLFVLLLPAAILNRICEAVDDRRLEREMEQRYG
jgi:hypothetical protein